MAIADAHEKQISLALACSQGDNGRATSDTFHRAEFVTNEAHTLKKVPSIEILLEEFIYTTANIRAKSIDFYFKLETSHFSGTPLGAGVASRVETRDSILRHEGLDSQRETQDGGSLSTSRVLRGGGEGGRGEGENDTLIFHKVYVQLERRVSSASVSGDRVAEECNAIAIVLGKDHAAGRGPPEFSDWRRCFQVCFLHVHARSPRARRTYALRHVRVSLSLCPRERVETPRGDCISVGHCHDRPANLANNMTFLARSARPGEETFLERCLKITRPA